MIPAIGVLVAACVFTRMSGLLFRSKESESGWRFGGQVLTRMFAGMTMPVAVFVAIDLLLCGATGVTLPELTR
ncbi:MAG TPA: hypothetical protein VGH34_19865 [Vicinamibacterales bacterium]|jgi:hypothetical protein